MTTVDGIDVFWNLLFSMVVATTRWCFCSPVFLGYTSTVILCFPYCVYSVLVFLVSVMWLSWSPLLLLECILALIISLKWRRIPGNFLFLPLNMKTCPWQSSIRMLCCSLELLTILHRCCAVVYTFLIYKQQISMLSRKWWKSRWRGTFPRTNTFLFGVKIFFIVSCIPYLIKATVFWTSFSTTNSNATLPLLFCVLHTFLYVQLSHHCLSGLSAVL